MVSKKTKKKYISFNPIINHEVIGEGGYGCIHAPALTCKTDKKKTGTRTATAAATTTRKNYISKSLINTDADNENKNNILIEKIDPTHKYHLEKPLECNLDNQNINNINALKKCNILTDSLKQRSKKEKITKDDYKDIKLLLMKNGGEDLLKYSTQTKTRKTTRKEILTFWIKCHTAIKGVELFIKKGIIHNDLKAENILYNEHTNEINIIDFGLMQNMKEKKKICFYSKKSQYQKVKDYMNDSIKSFFLNTLHWSWSFETRYNEESEFIKYIINTPFEKHLKETKEIIAKLEKLFNSTNYREINKILDESRTIENYYNFIKAISIETAPEFSFYNIMNDHLNNISDLQKEYMQLKTQKEKINYYEDFLDKHLMTSDIYGLGISFITVLKNTSEYIPSAMKKEFYALFYRMITPYLKERIEIKELLATYETILNKYIKEYNLSFVDNSLQTLISKRKIKSQRGNHVLVPSAAAAQHHTTNNYLKTNKKTSKRMRSLNKTHKRLESVMNLRKNSLLPTTLNNYNYA